MTSIIVIIFILQFLSKVESSREQPLVKLNEYQAYGFEYPYEHNNQKLSSHVYFGLPYAQPPVGQLRLEKPAALLSNPNRIVNNTELPAGCFQQENLTELDPGSEKFYPTSEDCLYLNIFTPSTPPSQGKKYPVLVWIHGGGFVYGMNRFFSWPQSARHFNARGIVVVHIQYRLAVFGFFALGFKKGEAGNFGLFDQTAALAFVNKHISKFGGDPKKVTVFGNSAGSISTHSLSLSPYSRNYMQQTIQSSGSLYNPWGNTVKTIESSKFLAQELGCDMSSVKRTKNCLKRQPVSAILKVLKGWISFL